MSAEKEILEALQSLPSENHQEGLSHSERLREEPAPLKPFKSAQGILAGRGISISAEDIDEVRREMWKNFPREDL